MSRPVMFKFRLYVAGDALNSAQSMANLTALCQSHLPDRHEIAKVFLTRSVKTATIRFGFSGWLATYSACTNRDIRTTFNHFRVLDTQTWKLALTGRAFMQLLAGLGAGLTDSVVHRLRRCPRATIRKVTKSFGSHSPLPKPPSY